MTRDLLRFLHLLRTLWSSMIAIRPEIEGAKADPTRIYNIRDIRFKS